MTTPAPDWEPQGPAPPRPPQFLPPHGHDHSPTGSPRDAQPTGDSVSRNRAPSPAPRPEESAPQFPVPSAGPHPSSPAVADHASTDATTDWSHPSSPAVASDPTTSPGEVSERPHPLSPLVKGWIAVVAVLFALGQELPGSNISDLGDQWILIAGVILLAFIGPLVLGYFSWRYTRFVINDQQVRIEFRFISHRSERIAFTKIQAVDVVQPLVARLLGLAALRIDVGSGGAAKSIEFLRRERAYQLRDFLITRAHGARHTVAESAQRPVSGIMSDVSAADQVVAQVPVGRLLASMVVSPGTVLVLIVSAVATAIFTFTGNLEAFAGTFVVVPYLIALVSSVLARIRNEWNFTCSINDDGGLRISSGLTSLVSQTIPRHRVQAVDITQPLLWRAFGWFRVRLDVLGQGVRENNAARADILLPVGPREQVNAVLTALWPWLDLDAVPRSPIPERARALRWFDAQTYHWGFDDQVLVASGGLLRRRTSIVPHARVQSVRLFQGPLQRRLRLASMHAHTTPGPVDVVCAHLDEADARALTMGELDRMRAARASAAEPHPDSDPGHVVPRTGSGAARPVTAF